jgi:hypothetical protein
MGFFYRGWNSFGPFKVSGDSSGPKQLRFEWGRINWIIWSAQGWGGTDSIDLPGPIDYQHYDNH